MHYTGTLESIARGGPPFNRPTNVSVATNGDLYITDGYGNARVHHFDADRAFAQIRRVLRPGGALALFWARSGDEGPAVLSSTREIDLTARVGGTAWTRTQ